MPEVGDTADKKGCADSQVAVKQPRADHSQEEAVAPGRLEGQEEQASTRLQGTEPAGRSVTRAGTSSGSWSFGGDEKGEHNVAVFLSLYNMSPPPSFG